MTETRPAGPRTARAVNDRAALDLLLEHGRLTGAQLASLTGLSRPTIADLVERLQQARLVEVVGESGEARRGPNAKLYGLLATRAHVMGLDVRTDGVTVAVADLTGRTLATRHVAMEPDIPTGQALARATDTIDAAAREAGVLDLHTIAIGAPGIVDPTTGELGRLPGHPEWHTRLTTALRDRNHRVLVENEVNLAGIAERHAGAARDRDTFVLLWLDRGVGAAVTIGGRLWRGAHGGAGELGFLPVAGAALPTLVDGCGGGLDALAGAAGVRALAAEYGLCTPGHADDDADIAAGAVRDAARVSRGASPSGAGQAFLDVLAGRIALGVSAVCAVLDPQCVVLAGSIAVAGSVVLAERVRSALGEISPVGAEVRVTSTPGNPILHGAVRVATAAMHADLFTDTQQSGQSPLDWAVKGS